MANIPLWVPSASRQIAFHQLLVAARKTWLKDALSEALSRADPGVLKAQISQYVPLPAQQILAVAGIRDEYVFPTPLILETAPTLIGYYRLLLGIPQKTFYGTGTGMGRFRSMETRGYLNDRQRENLPLFCSIMSDALADLLRQLSPTVTPRDVDELPLLTIGSQFQGGNNNIIGRRAAEDVFLVLAELLKGYLTNRTVRRLFLAVQLGQTVSVTLASDPDVAVEFHEDDRIQRQLAIEIKGGTDRSNAHNRAGEAEKSHLKARAQGFRRCWTVIATTGLTLTTLQAESPTTDEWFDAGQILGREGEDWKRFCARFMGELGLS